MGSRRKAREVALQFLYQLEINSGSLDEGLRLFWTEHPVQKEVRVYATELIRGSYENLDKIDSLLADYTQNWDVKRMAAVDRNLLRLATYEMLLAQTAPPIVVINETVDIAKKYSTPDSGAFVNGILDRIRMEKIPNERRDG